MTIRGCCTARLYNISDLGPEIDSCVQMQILVGLLQVYAGHVEGLQHLSFQCD
uniref:Uncharacterized protein n=1 Tax=Physcomitrium patens TaxID=3218 RepID=A0A2K1IK12_PHYPA|nr:hypothetical protein PHYPA_028314 [Physcomitrium patens]